jgi:hypothetical protein
VLDRVQQRRDHAKVGGDRRLQRQQRKNPLVDLEVPAVDAVVVEHHQGGQLDVLMMERLHRAIQGRHHQVERAERLLLEPLQLLLEMDATGARSAHDANRTCP